MSSKAVLFHNASIHTVDRQQPTASWLTVLGDRIQRVGSGPAPELAKRIDLGGKTVVPGFVDAHAHFFQTGLDSLCVNLSGADSLVEIGQRMAAPGDRKRSWIFAHGFQEETLGAQLARRDLDVLFPSRPVWVNRIDYHSAIVNTAALTRLEIPEGTDGLMRGDDGVINGILRAQAYFHAKARISRLYPVEVKEKAVREAAHACSRHGITAVHALEGGQIFGDEGVPTLLKRIPTLPLHVTVFLQEKNVYLTTRFGFEHLGGCILIDGSIGSYTAALDAPYADNPDVRGTLYEKPRSFFAFVEEAHVAGVQLAFHAIGSRAIQLVLDGYERALIRSPRFDHRHRIEHFELATDVQIARARDLGVIVSMQPAFEHFWGGPDGMYAARLGDRWRTTNRLRTILDADLMIAGGSDSNVTPAHPLLGIHAAVNHPNEEQRTTPAEALRMMTLDAAYAGFNERLHGSLSPGKQANFAVLDRDPLTVPAAEISGIAVEQTWYRGREVFARGQITSRRHASSQT